MTTQTLLASLALATTLAFSTYAQEEGTTVQRMGYAGGAGGNEVQANFLPAGGTLKSIRVCAARYVDAIEFTYEDAHGQTHKQLVGRVNDKGDWQDPIDISRGVRLVGISGRCAKYVDRIRFHFSDGSESRDFGGSGGEVDYKFILTKKDGKYVGTVTGFYGRADRYIDAAGLLYRPN